MLHVRTPHLRRLAAAILAAGTLMVAAPATAVPDPGATLHSLEHVKATGEVRSRDGRFERGCQSHGYRYEVRPHGSDWSLELFLIDSRGKRIANGYEWKGADPREGRGRFEFCAQSTRPGKFTVRSRLTWDDGEYHEKWLEPRTIRLRR